MSKLRALVALALLLAAAPSRSETGDPTVDEVVRMLAAGVGETVVVRWLEGAPPPGRLGADEIVALREAGASDELIVRLMDAGPGAETPAGQPAPAVAAPPARPDAAPAPMAASPPATRFRLSFSPDTVEEEEPWDLYVYLDGEILAWLPTTSSGFFGGRTLDLERRLDAGPHVLRLLRERHEERRGERWRHRARVAPVEIAFEVGGSEPLQVEVEVLEPRFPVGVAPGPVSWTVRTQDRVLDERRRQGPVFFDWPALCEDVEANLEPGEKPSGAERGELESCLRWPALWPGEVPPRSAVRDRLEAAGFRPAPAGIVG